MFRIKQDLYRLPHLSIDRLALLAKIDSFNTFDRIEYLQKQGILHAEGAQRLQWLISEVIWQRLKVYAHYKKQKEEMNPLTKAFGFDDPKLVQKQFASSPKDLEKLTKIYQILLPFYQAMKAFFKGDPSILRKEVLWDERDFTLGQIAARLLQYEKAKNYYLKASEASPENGGIWNALGLVELRLGNAVEALSYFQRALAIREKIYGKEHPNVATV